MWLGLCAAWPQEPEAAKATYVVLGFAWDSGDGQWSTDLEGIVDHRRATRFGPASRAIYRAGSGNLLLTLKEPQPAAFYAFRVEPGEFGLAGFLLTRDPADTGLLQRFLRYYMLPAGKASFIGVFRLFQGESSERGVRLESGLAAYERMRVSHGLGVEMVLTPSYQSLTPAALRPPPPH